MSDVASIMARRKPRRATVRLLLDGELQAQVERLTSQIVRAKAREVANPQGLASPVVQLEAGLASLRVEADEAVTEFTFQAIPRPEFEELKRVHPPTAEQWERYKTTAQDLPVLLAMQLEIPEYHETGLAPALLAACAVSPIMTRDEAQLLWDELSDAEATLLFDAAWGVNEQAATRPFSGTDTAMTPNFGPTSTTPQNVESPFLSLAEGS